MHERISGLLLAIPLLIILYILVKVDKHYLNSRIANLFGQRTFRLVFMLVLFITIMLSSIYWRASVGD